MNEIQLFSYGKEKHPVRTVEIDGEVWFVAKDVCDILEIVDYHQAVETLDDDEKGVGYNIPTPGGMQDMTVISEPGLYKLTFKSRKREAKNFARWVTHTVLPAIRQTGRFSVSESLAEEAEPSAETRLQRIGLIIRAAEHKAVPQSEQFRLLSIAVKDLTGTELNLECLVPEKCQAIGLMDLPEVFGTIKKGNVKSFGRGKGSVQFYSLLEIADALRIAPSDFNDFADEHNLKAGCNGEWVRVKTSQGEAREFVYLRNVIFEYRNKEAR